MAAKLLHSLADDNPDLQKQIGCMTGIFQIFDRQHFLSGRRPTQRRILPPPSGNSKFSNGSLDVDSSNAYNRETMERNPNKHVNDKQRGSTESSRASFSSSSRSSSFSSLDCGRTGQPDPSSFDRIIFPETPSRDPAINQTSASPKLGRLSVDLRDVVKDSMYRDSRVMSVQTMIKDEGLGHTSKHKDSPRPFQLSKDMPADVNESLRVLAKLRDAPWYYNEKELPRLSYESKDGYSLSMPRDAPRFSYDGRDTNRKIKDLPRLSLDSRESSGRSMVDSKSTHLSGNTLQPSAIQSRPSSVVAKLMGLDMLPNVKLSDEGRLGPIKTSPGEHHGPSSGPLRVPDVYRPVRLPKSPRSSRKEPTSPRWKNPDGVMKPVSSSKFPMEPAPWKNLDTSRASPKQASRQKKSSASTSSTSPSVYGEIERRLKDIEFKQSGKDLRALKQILEAMQAKGLLETTKEHPLNSIDSATSPAISSKLKAKEFESPIVIMKPAKLVQKSGIPIDGLPSHQRPQSGEVPAQLKNSASRRIPKDQTSRDNRRDQATTSDRKTNNMNLRVPQTSSRPPQVAKDNTTNSSKNSGSISPRLQKKKLEFDKKSRPPTPPSDSNKTRSHPNRHSTESGSPGGRLRPKTSNLQQSDDYSSGKSNESRNLTLESRNDIEATTTEQALEIASCQNLSMEAFNCCMSEEMKDGVNLRLSDEDKVRDLAIAPEQPSPISVLDSSAYMEDSLSPVKQTSHSLQGDAIAESNDNPREDLWSTVDNLTTNSTILELPSEISRKKLESIDNLVQKLRRLNSTHDEDRTDYIASLCENTNPDHRYVSEILLASGLLLRDLSSGLTTFQLHPSGHPINPELFFVLEQTKASSFLSKGESNPDEVSLTKSKPEKFHRKLIFDVVNEILGRKLGLVGLPSEPWFKPEKLAKKTLNAQKLLRELCSEIEVLQAKKPHFSLEGEDDDLKSVLWDDMMHRSDNWTDFRGEISGIVLDVERSIFKDLVGEIVVGESVGLRGKPNRRRQLFSKA